MKTIRFIKKKEGVAVGDVKRVAAVVARNNIASGYAELVEKETETKQGASSEGKPLSKMNVAELTAYAAEKSIDLGEAKTKAQIKEAIENSENP